LPSLVAVTLVVPAPTAVTRPLELTDAMLLLALDHETTRPVRMLLLTSRVVADSLTVSPTWSDGAAGKTDTDATGIGADGLTVIADCPVFPSLVAVIVALPAATAVTKPDAEIVAMTELLELQVTVRPVSVLLFASRVVADNWTVPPIARVAVAGATDTDATGIGAGALTVIADCAVLPSLAAVICADPAAIAVARPSAETVAIPLLLELHVVVRPVSVLLFASRVVADNWTVPPIANVEVAGETNIDATGIGGGTSTVNVARPLWPSLEPVMVAVPAASAVTSPVGATEAIAGAELCHETARPLSGLPTESSTVAVARAFCPMMTAAGVIATRTVATGVGVGGGEITASVA